MLRPWLNSLLALLLALAPAAAQDFGFNLPKGGENWNHQIIFLGGTTGGGANANDPAPAGSDLTAMGASIGDVGVATCHCTDSTAPATCAITGPSGISNLVNQTSGPGRQTVYYWFGVAGNLTTDVTCTNPGSNSGSTSLTVMAFRGVDILDVDDAASTTATATGSAPDAASITTVRDNARTIVTCSATVQDATPGTVTNYASAAPGFLNSAQTDTVASTTTTAIRDMPLAAGVEAPAAWSSWSCASCSWACLTVALKPWR